MITFTLPLLLWGETQPLPEKVSSNKIYAGIHWAVRKKIVDKYHAAIKEYFRETRPVINDYPVRISCRFSYSSRALDASNCFFMAKCIEDGLCAAGILKDDSVQYVREIRCRSEKVKNGKDEVKVIIELDD